MSSVESMAPDWQAIEAEITCPLCRYNLRGLSEARCPECGFEFQWPEILEITRRKHPYLFEHHPERNVWSFFQTLIGGLNPWRFWKTLHPAQPADEWRLTLYRWIVKAIAALPLIAAGLWLLMMSMGWPVDDWEAPAAPSTASRGRTAVLAPGRSRPAPQARSARPQRPAPRCGSC